MVEFGKQLQISIASGRPEWKSCYVDYGRLKKLLKKLNLPKDHKRVFRADILPDTIISDLSTTKVKGRSVLSPANKNLLKFRNALDHEIEKVVLFLLHRQGCLASKLSDLSRSKEELREKATKAWLREETSGDVKHELNEICNKYRATGILVLEFISYVEINVTAVRKILKKHDKTHPHKQLSQEYVMAFASDDDSHLDQLYHYGGLSALMTTLKQAFWELHMMELNLLTMEEKNQSRHGRIMPASMFDLEEIGAGEAEVVDDLSLSKIKPQYCPTTITLPNEPVLAKIAAARRRLKQSTKYVQVVAAQALMMFDDDGDNAVEDMTRSQKISSFLNLCSTFLYMTNYYIIAPTSGQYADKLGSTEAMAGIIIGMTPNAALIATVLYCWWSNYSYKSALIFAASCSLIGNVFYAFALQQNSLFFVMIGRFLNGFGSARSINRRFIADTFSSSDRTAASAAFVSAGALGMAAGPAIASLLGRVDFPEDNLIWTVETSPGWVMLTLWSIYYISAVLFFEEPDRSHLFSTKPIESTELFVIDTERQPLIKNISTISSLQIEKKVYPLYRNIPVMMTLWIYFVLKLALECLLSSSATVASYYFEWDARHTGTFLAVLGLLMFPANLLVAKLSHRFEDREIIYVTLIMMFLSVLGMIAYRPSHYSMKQYTFFGVCVFLSTNSLEGPNMSLLSKTIPRSWAKGTFNSGFLATEAGTAARSVGDVLISAVASLLGFSNLLNATFLPLTVLVLVSIILTRHFFESMVEEDEDDDEESEVIYSETNVDSVND